MILALAAAFQLAVSIADSAGARRALVVKDASRSVSLAVVQTADGPMVRADKLRPVLPVTVSRVMGQKWMLISAGVAIEVEQGMRYARVGDVTYQLLAAPALRNGVLHVPVQLVAEIVPRVLKNLIWDAERYELRAFTAVSRFESDAPARRSAAPSSGPASGPPGSGSRRAGAPTSTATTTGPLRTRHLVVVDAGHGGRDAGMQGPIGPGPQVSEKTITLDVARRVGAALNERGVDVKYTRTRDTLIDLSDRGRIANEARADLFVSIHVNAAHPGWKDPGGARGFETYFLAEAKTEDARRVERMENEVVRFETTASARSGDPLSFLLNDMAQNEHLREANELAALIQGRMARVHPGTNRGVKQAGFRVLVTAFMPAVLVEIGFGTNPAEAAYMSDPRQMDQLSAAISEGIVEYLKRYERRVTTAPGRTVLGGSLARP